MSDSTSSRLVFKFADGSTLPIDSNLSKLSSFVDEKQKSGAKEIELSDKFIGEAFNEFCKKFFPKHTAQLKDLENSIDKEDWWMEFIVKLLPLYLN